MPAALRLAWNWPAAPRPVSITTVLLPVFTASGEYGTTIWSACWAIATQAVFTSSRFLLMTKVSGNLKVLEPSVTTVTSIVPTL